MVRLIREQGFKENSHFYHRGDGGYCYHVNVETASSIYFKCVLFERGCRGRAILRLAGGPFRETGIHNHPASSDFVGERHFRQNVLNQCREARYTTFQEIVDDARRDRRYSRRVRSRMTLRRLRCSMYQARSKSYPEIPHTLRELTQTLLGHTRVSMTVDGLHNMFAGSVTAEDGSHHVMFTTPRMLQFMGQVKILQGDGTFRARPSLPQSSQCFVLVTTWRHCVIPLCWVLMENRTIPAYSAVFRLLKQLCPNLNPDIIISDWELAQQLAWEEAFPNAEIQGCLWHLCRAFLRKAGKLRLMKYKTALPRLFEFIRKACVISLLPPEFFETGLQVVRNEARQADILIAYLLRQFFTYVQDKWLGHVSRKNWMTFYNALHRTNNSCETLNRLLRKAVGAYRPNVYLFMDALARLEHNAHLDIALMQEGGSARRNRRWQSVYSDRQLKALMEDLEMDVFHDRNTAVSNFLERAADLVQGVFKEHLEHDAGQV